MKRLLPALALLLALTLLAPVAWVNLAPESATRWAIDLERTRSGLVRKEIELLGGMRYAYLDGGQGEPLLLLHGFGGDKDNFTRIARFLVPHYRVIVPDHAGFGESSHQPDADYSPAAQAARLHTLAQSLNIQNLHIGGNSMGGQIALSYAAQYPKGVKSLWLLDPAGVWSAPESELRQIIRETKRNPLLVRSEDDFAAIFALVMNDPPYIPRPMLNVLAQERIRNFALEERIFKQLAEDSVEARITGLTTPTLIVWGDKDRLIHVKTADILHTLLPKSQVSIQRDVGHLPMIERPQQSAEDYLRFRAGL